jgi:hypothetical protein
MTVGHNRNSNRQFPTIPAPPRRLFYEHFKQAVLANMKGAGQPRDFDFDITDSAQSMSVFEDGGRKEWLSWLVHLEWESDRTANEDSKGLIV